MINQEMTETLIDLIDPPPGMLDITGVAQVVRAVLEHAWLIKFTSGSEGQKPNFLDLVPQLKDFCSAITNQAEGSADWVEQPGAMTQFKTSHPIYGALHELAKKQKPPSQGRLQLFAHALVAAHNGVQVDSVSAKMPSANVQAGFRELRRLSDRLLDSLTFDAVSREGCYQALLEAEQAESSEFSGAELDRLGHIRRVIGLSLGAEKPLEISARKKQVNGSGRVSINTVSPDQLGDVGGVDFSLMEVPTSSVEQENAARLEALPVNDLTTTAGYAVPSERSNPRSGGSLRSGAFKRRHIADQLRRSAQALTTRWDRLTAYEIDSLISELSWDGAGQNPGELAAGLVLLTGRPLSTVLNARLYSTINQVPENISDDSIAICKEGSFIQVHVPVPERMRPLRTEWEPNVHHTHSQLRLPILKLLWNLIIRSIGLADSQWCGYLFPRPDIADIQDGVENFISESRSESGARITLTRLQRCIYNEIADVQGDVADGVFITGNQPATGAHVGIHYYCVAESDLQKRYLTATRDMVEGGHKELMEPVTPLQQRSYFIGTPFCLKPERLSVLISDLRNRLKADLEQPLAPETLIEIHNSFTSYVLVFMAFATGYRSVHAPLSRSSDLDPSSRMLVVADKTDAAFSHARLVPVPELFSLQLDLYRQHRERVVEQMWALLGIKDPGHFLFFLSKASRRTKKSEKIVKVRQVSPTTLAENLNGISDLPLNLNRHFLRSELRHRGVSAELVDTWMGHWLVGQEPMGRFSALNPTEYVSEIESMLNVILDDLGWTAEEGLL